MKKFFTIVALGIFAIGCTKAPILTVYSLEVPKVEQRTNSSYMSKVLKVTFPQSVREEVSEKMNFSYSNTDYGTYLNSQWSNHMSRLIQGTLIDVLEKSHIFKAVLPDTTTLKVNYSLESNIYAFEHRVRGKYSDAVISIQFTLINADTGKLAKTKRFTYIEPTATVDAKGYAMATNIAIDKLCKEILVWLYE